MLQCSTWVHGDEEADAVVQSHRGAVREQEMLLALPDGGQDAVDLCSEQMYGLVLLCLSCVAQNDELTSGSGTAWKHAVQGAHLLRADGEDVQVDAVELVEAAPQTALGQALVDLACVHGRPESSPHALLARP
jgi:hypothetical protein